jgi:hypothetical protein
MSFENRVQEMLERNAEAVRPAADPIGRATKRLHKAQRRRAGGIAALLVLAAVGSAVAWNAFNDRKDVGIINPGPGATSTPTVAGERTSHEVIGAEFTSKKVSVALTDAGFAITTDGGGRWVPLGFGSPWAGDFKLAGDQLIVAFEEGESIKIAHHPLNGCDQRCTTIQDLGAGPPAPDGGSGPEARARYQGEWLSFVSPEHGWLNVGISQTTLASEAELYETTDAGQTWHLVSRPMVGPIQFTDDTTGFLKGSLASTSDGDRLFRTTDAGRTWKDISPATPSGCYRNEAGLPLPHFFDSQNGVFLSRLSCGGLSYNQIAVMATTDGGNTWTSRGSLQPKAGAEFGDLIVIDSKTFLVQQGKAILESTDGGRTFKTSVPDAGVLLVDMKFLDPGLGWTTVIRGDCFSKGCSDPRHLYVTFDRGRSLRAIDVFF